MKTTTKKCILSAVMALLTVLCSFLTTDVITADAAVTLMGDLNGDGEMTTKDAREFLILLSTDGSMTDAQKAVADVNGDGKYSTLDVRRMLQLIVQAEEKTPVRSIWIPYFEVESLLTTSAATTRSNIDACLQDCVDRGANTVYFHVRANSDAYYNSAYFNPNYKTASLLASGFDPLACAVELAHDKGLKIEAWVNPYRIGSDPSRAKADAVFKYGNGYYYVPSDAAVQQLVVNGVKELVNNYDIDGVQFDDYFYPGDSVPADSTADFETADYAAYQNSGGTLGVADWRRAEVNKLMAATYAACHTRTGCVFGISPSYDFEDNYHNMYADAATWVANAGYIDYIAPQLYIGFEHQYAPYETIISRWNSLTRHPSVSMIAGLALYKTGLLEDEWAGSGAYEWLNHNDILSRQIASAKNLGWDGVALYSHLSFDIDSTRNATVAAADNAAACEAWLTFR